MADNISRDKRVKTALQKFERDQKHWQNVYKEADQDLYFMSDNTDAQWLSQDYEDRRSTGRPALTMDKLSQFTRQVANQIRMSTPSINVIPSDGAENEKTADVFKGLIKNIEYQSKADDAYDTAVLSAVRCSLGWIRVDHEYESDTGFDQRLVIKRVNNTLSVWIDCESEEADGSDAKHGTIITTMSVAAFKAKYKDKDPISFEVGNGQEIEDQTDEDQIQIAEHYYIEETEKDMAMYEGEDEAQPYDETRKDIKARRSIKERTVKHCIMSGKEILEETTFPGRYIPIVPVYGEEMWLRGERNLFSLVRKAKDPQRLHNYWKSLETEILQKMPNAPFMAAEGQTEEYAEDWLNSSKTGVLRYKQEDASGNPAPPPQRMSPPTPPAGILQASAATVDDIKSSMGMFNASLGEKSNETSGIAIQKRKEEGAVGQYHFADNLNKAITHVGKILVCAIPTVYDTARIISIIGDEEEVSPVGINGAKANGQEEDHLLGDGKYDVRVTTGNSFSTMRQESAEFFMQVAQTQPELMNVMGDLVFRYMDVPGAEAMSNRMKKIVPPEMLEEEGQEVDPQVAAMQQQMQQLQQELQQAQMIIQEGEKLLEDKTQDTQLKVLSEQHKAQESAAKIQIEQQRLQLDMERLQLERDKADFEANYKTAQLELEEQGLELDVAKGLGDMVMNMSADENNPGEGLSLGNEAGAYNGEYPNDY